MRAFEYREPDNLEEVLALLHDHGEDAKIIAGGTALVIMLNQRLIKPSYLISLRKLSALNSVESVDGVLQLGALVTHRDMETSPVIRDRVPVRPSQPYGSATWPRWEERWLTLIPARTHPSP